MRNGIVSFNFNLLCMFKSILSVTFLLLCEWCLAQTNLVPNTSFESYKRLPDGIGEGRACLESWTTPTVRGDADYYHEQSKNKDSQTTQNYFGGEKPHSGQAYAGFCVTPTYREFLATKLLQPLTKGEEYQITINISKGDKLWLGNLQEIGVLFLKKEMIIPFGQPMTLPPQVIFYQENGFTQHEGWQTLTATFTADGTEQWMVIGAHEWQCDTCKSIAGKPRTQNPPVMGAVKDAHYFVDDVSLTLVRPEVIQYADPVEETVVLIDTVAFVPGLNYTFHDILFKTNSAELADSAQVDLDRIVKFMKENPDLKVTVSGHTDNVGSPSANVMLSKARAESVKKYLVRDGINPDRIRTKGYGSAVPIADNATESGRKLNRRVEVLFE